MPTPEPMRIGYAGTLAAAWPDPSPSALSTVAGWFWEFRPDSIDHRTRSADVLFRGVARLRKADERAGDQVRIALWGNIDPACGPLARELGIEHLVSIEGHKSKSETRQQLSACDVLFLPLESGRGGRGPLFVPGKLFEYLEIGKPVLALAGESDCLRILRRAGVVADADPRDPDAVAAVLRRLIELGPSGRRERYRPDSDYIETEFAPQVMAGRVAAALRAVLQQPRRSGRLPGVFTTI